MRYMDFSSWQAGLTAILGIALVALVGVGIRVLVMLTVQQRQQRANRQINERLRTLIAAYKVLGGSFTGQLAVDPRHLRELRQQSVTLPEGIEADTPGSERARRIRDAVEAALSDIILLGTEEQVRLASKAAADMVASRPIHTAELVVSLRNFIRDALDLDPVPAGVTIPVQGPQRQSGAGGKGGAGRGEREGGGGGRGEGGGGGGGMGGMAAGMGGGMGLGLGLHHHDDDSSTT